MMIRADHKKTEISIKACRKKPQIRYVASLNSPRVGCQRVIDACFCSSVNSATGDCETHTD